MHCSRCGSPVEPRSAACGVCGAPTGDIPLARPSVVTLLAVLHFIGGAAGLVVGALSVALGSGPGTSSALGTMLGLALAAVGLLQLACGIGLWTLRPWGRTLQIVVSAIGLLAFPVGTVVSGLILWLFLKPGARVLFSGRPAQQLSEEEAAAVSAFGSGGLARAVKIVIVLLLLAVPVGILAAITVPSLLRARQAGNEASAIGSLRAINSGQFAFASSCGQGQFAADLASLALPPETGAAGFVSPDLGSDPVVKSGYLIRMVADAPAPDAPPACNGVRVTPRFFVSATPADPGTSGTRFFATNSSGTVYWSTGPIPVTLDGEPPGATPLQ